jgi:hypothetical protein
VNVESVSEPLPSHYVVTRAPKIQKSMNFTTIVHNKMKLFRKTLSLREFPRKVLSQHLFAKKVLRKFAAACRLPCKRHELLHVEFFAIATVRRQAGSFGTNFLGLSGHHCTQIYAL